MSNDETPPCKRRFKGVENFLRRIAFNLGNSPSQTEVKIISCIPIDVTDLQQKILSLEKELHETRFSNVGRPDNIARQKSKSECPAGAECTTMYGSAIAANLTSTLSRFNFNAPESSKFAKSLPQCYECLPGNKKSNVSFIFPSTSKQGTEHTCNFASAENSVVENRCVTDHNRNIFRRRLKKKLLKDKARHKTQLVYYAQTRTRSPKLTNNDKSGTSNIPNINISKFYIPKDDLDKLNRSYLVDVYRKHHDPQLTVDQFSNTSNFSRPICRDNNPKKQYTNTSDVCSCCHGRFQNLDNYITKNIPFQSNITNYSCNTKYDADIYDIIPVKEKFIKHKNETFSKFENYIDMKHCPEKSHTRYRYHPFIVNSEVKKEFPRVAKKNIKKRETPKSLHIERVHSDQQQKNVSSKSCCVDCGDVYQKPIAAPVLRNFNKQEHVATETLSTNAFKPIQNKQTDTITDNKTEVTLNQIKVILQSVLAEVRTNSNVNSSTNDQKKKKDAIIQKGPSQNLQEASTLLHSFTYNTSYNKNPYVPSCTKQLPYGPYYIPEIMSYDQAKYLQNFPVFIQPAPGRHMCSCFCRNSAHKTNKRSTTIATNTEDFVKKTSSKETEKLIKEIYKSMALNMNYPSKDISTSEYDDLKSTENSITSRTKDVIFNSSSKAVKVLQNKEVEVLLTPLTSNATESKMVNTAESSHLLIQNNKLGDKDQSTGTDFPYRMEETIKENDHDDVSNEPSNDEESDATIIVPSSNHIKNKNDRSGFIQKMFKKVKLFKKNKGVKQLDDEEGEEERSDGTESDDYETVYSEKVNKPHVHIKPRRRNVIEFSRPPTNAIYAKMQKIPYMEQEYRRRWNEYLTFHDRQNARSFGYMPKTPRHPPFWQEYETRGALIQPNNQVRQKGGTEKAPDTNSLENKLKWLKKHKMGIKCGDQWKRFIVEN